MDIADIDKAINIIEKEKRLCMSVFKNDRYKLAQKLDEINLVLQVIKWTHKHHLHHLGVQLEAWRPEESNEPV